MLNSYQGFRGALDQRRYAPQPQVVAQPTVVPQQQRMTGLWNNPQEQQLALQAQGVVPQTINRNIYAQKRPMGFRSQL
jgi:hypothetical protein